MNNLSERQKKLKIELLKIAKEYRKKLFNDSCDLNKAQQVSSDYVLENGIKMKRKRIVLLSKGCSIESCSMCPLPNESLSLKSSITEDNLKKQLDNAFLNEDINTYQG